MSKCTYDSTTTRSMPIGLVLSSSTSSSWVYGHVQAKLAPILQTWVAVLAIQVRSRGTWNQYSLLVLSHHPSHVSLPRMFWSRLLGFSPMMGSWQAINHSLQPWNVSLLKLPSQTLLLQGSCLAPTEELGYDDEALMCC